MASLISPPLLLHNLHSVAYSTPPIVLYSKLKLAELKERLRSRGLPATGTKPYLIERLREADWQEWKKQHSLFPQFARLPSEIQVIIWRKSLPGPRTLCFTQAIDTEKLYFPKKHHTPNPAALSTCKGAKYDKRWDKWFMEGIGSTLALTFDTNPIERELQKGMPEIQIAEAFRIKDSERPESQPEGELYVRSPRPLSTAVRLNTPRSFQH